MARAIGIDLGTTYTVVATIEGGRPQIIPNAEGQRLTPSVVAFTGEGEPLVGEGAKRQAAANPERTIFSIKRRMGSSYKVQVGEKEYTPEEISSLILRNVKADAENYLGERIDQAVITVPAYFNDRQRKATKEAGVLAGLDVLRVINEPTAAALAYGLEREDAHTILVWDLGGGTFDVSILDLGEGIFEVRAVSGDVWLGSDDFDQRLMDYLTEEYRRIWGEDFPKDASVWQRLRAAAEKAKIELSSSVTARVSLPCVATIPRPRHLATELTREQLESLTTDLLQRMVTPTRQALADAGLTPQEIDRVILVGGATRMPAVRNLVRNLIGKEPYRRLNPDEVVALGAAIQAGMLLDLVQKVVLLDVLPLSLGVATQGGLFARIIHRNTPLPAAEAHVFTTAADNQTSMDIHVLQGERELAVDNVSLAHIQLNGITPALKGIAKVEIAFEVDVDGIVQLTANDLLTEEEVKTMVVSSKVLDSHEVECLAREAEASAERDREERARIVAGIEADNLIAAGEKVLAGLDGRGTAHEAEQLIEAISQVREALAIGMSQEIRRCGGMLRKLLASISGGGQVPPYPTSDS